MEDCMKFTILLMNIAGLGDSANFATWKAKVYRMYQLFVQAGVVVFTVGVTVEMYVLRDDTENALEMIGWIITHIILCFKLYVFVFKKEKVDYIMNSIPKHFVIRGRRIIIMNKDLIDVLVKRGRNVVMAYALVMNFSFILYVDISPLINYLTSDPEPSGNLTQPKQLPVRLWLPYDDTKSPMYEITYVYLAISAHTEGWIVCAIDVFCMTSIIYITGQFQLLCNALRNCTKNIKQSINGEVENSEEDKIIFYNKNDIEAECTNSLAITECVEVNESSLQLAEVYLKECIRHHQNLITLTEKLDELVSSIFFLQFLTASIMICMLGFRITTMDFDINLMKLLSYLLTCICQLCLYCTFGSNLMSQSEEVYNAVYSCEWYDQSHNFKNFLNMIIMRAQRSVSITAGQFGTLSLPLFASMMQTSYSYLALLRQLNEEVEDNELN